MAMQQPMHMHPSMQQQMHMQPAMAMQPMAMNQPLVPVLSPHGAGSGQSAYAVKKLERDMETLAQSVLKVESDVCRLAEEAAENRKRANAEGGGESST